MKNEIITIINFFKLNSNIYLIKVTIIKPLSNVNNGIHFNIKHLNTKNTMEYILPMTPKYLGKGTRLRPAKLKKSPTKYLIFDNLSSIVFHNK